MYGLSVDDWSSALADDHTSGDHAVVLTSLNGLPSLPSGRIYRFTALTDPDTESEVILGVFEATGVSGSTLTGVTAAAGYADADLASGVTVQIRVCAATVDELQTTLDSHATTLALKAPLASPTFTGVPSGPTPAVGTNTTQFATTASVLTALTSVKRPTSTQPGTAYTLALVDANKLITLTNASAVTLTVAPNTSVAFPFDTEVDLVQMGAGQVTVAAGAGVTINSYQSKVSLSGQYAGATLKKLDTDTWLLRGTLS